MKLKVGSTYKDGKGRLVLIIYRDAASSAVANPFFWAYSNYFGIVLKKYDVYEVPQKLEYKKNGRYASYRESIYDLKEEVNNPDQPTTELGKTLYL